VDPVTIWIFCLATAWVIRNLAEDGYAAVRGRTSPRIARRQAAYELAQKHAATTGTPTVGQAVTGRIADRIANPRPPGPFRRYLSGLWEDSWEDAQERHEQRRERRAEQRRKQEERREQEEREQEEREASGRPDPDDALRTRQCRGPGCDVLVVEPLEWCAGCRAAAWRADEPEPDPRRRCTKCRRLALDAGPLDEVGECPDCQADTRDDFADQERLADLDDEQVDRLNNRPPGTCRVCLASIVATDISGRCESCARGNFGHAHYCTAGCGQPVATAGVQCAGCEKGRARPASETPEPQPDSVQDVSAWDPANPGPCVTPDCGKAAECAAGLCYDCDHGVRWMCQRCGHRRQAAHDPNRLCWMCRHELVTGAPLPPVSQPKPAERLILGQWARERDEREAAGLPVYDCSGPGYPGSGYCLKQVHQRGQMCPDCALSEVDHGPAGETTPTRNTDDDSEPTSAPGTTRKDIPVSSPAEINGDVASPLTALAFATNCLDLNTAIMNELDAMANNLECEGVGPACVQIVRDAWAAGEQFATAAANAVNEYARHVATQAEIAGDAELRDTVRGTYLDGSGA
jgi:hypothetical protein